MKYIIRSNARKKAKESGAVRYFTGLPCKYGHISERLTCNGICKECSRIIEARFRKTEKYKIVKKNKAKKYYIKHKEKVLGSQKDYARRNKDIIALRRKEYREKNSQKLKEYRQQWFANNKERVTKKLREKFLANPDIIRKKRNEYIRKKSDHIKKWRKEWLRKNRERLREKKRLSYQKNKSGYFARAVKRKAALLQRIPVWADFMLIDNIYKERQRISQETGIIHHVDHIIPLNGKNVSGLHVHNNLRVVPAEINLSKNAKLIEELVYA